MWAGFLRLLNDIRSKISTFFAGIGGNGSGGNYGGAGGNGGNYSSDFGFYGSGFFNGGISGNGSGYSGSGGSGGSQNEPSNPWWSFPIRPGMFGFISFDPDNPWDNLENPFEAEDDLINFDVDGIEDVYISNSAFVIPTLKTIGFSKRNPPNKQDMLSGTNGDISGIRVSPYINWMSLIQKTITDPTLTDDELFESMSNLFWWTTLFSGDLRSVSKKMIEKFRYGPQSPPFMDKILNEKASEATDMKRYISAFKDAFSKQLKKHGGDINLIETIDMRDDRPKFSNNYHKFSGLMIMVNDTESTDIKLQNYKIDASGNWEADVIFEITDHFGLDQADVLKFQEKERGFVAWWTLQHRRNYKPFLTKIYVTKKLKGKL